ncbi:enoyl-CoA hydratase/isomerase family protein [Nocardioides sp.]|uniref:enoyl-CoA hydratase/isomerase family protein n=1 Tax=Nocardioides sp. TaxID=35761 RepID=UPI0039E24510
MLSLVDVVTPTDLLDGAAALRCESGDPRPALVVVDLDEADWDQAGAVAEALRQRRSTVLVGRSTAPLPAESAPLLEQLTCTLAPGGPGRLTIAAGDDDLTRIGAVVSQAPRAATILAGILPLTDRSGVADGLVVESLAYSTLLAGAEFAAWRAQAPRRAVPEPVEPVLLERTDDVLTVTLNRPERHNAFGRAVRDGLIAGLELARLDPSIRETVVRGRGRSFCSGGDLDEFGTTADSSWSHLLRLQLSAGYAVHLLAERVRFVVHGACIGAGVEVPSFARRVEAAADAYFQLPELSMGLVPGAGGTVSLSRRIGRWRTAFLALTNRPIDAARALEWGLVDAIR